MSSWIGYRNDRKQCNFAATIDQQDGDKLALQIDSIFINIIKKSNSI